jgi:hypothetical protein
MASFSFVMSGHEPAGWKRGGLTHPRSVPGQTAMDRRVSGLGLAAPALS